MDWTVASWTPLMVLSCNGCDISFSNFSGLALQHITITDSVAKEVDFAESDLTAAIMRGTDFLDSRFLHTTLSQADFSQCKNYFIDVTLNKIKHAKFSLPEALTLLKPFNITLVD